MVSGSSLSPFEYSLAIIQLPGYLWIQAGTDVPLVGVTLRSSHQRLSVVDSLGS